jgi:membrane dipeptidase
MKYTTNARTAKGIFRTLLVLSTGFITTLPLPSCTNRPGEKTEEELWQRALEISKNNIILDSHIDWPERIYHRPVNVAVENGQGDFDLPRANRGGLNAALSVLYIPPGLGVEESRTMVDSLYKMVTGYAVEYPDKFALARNPGEILKNFENGIFSIPLALENGAPIGNDLEYLKLLEERGIVYITLCHAKTNQICDSNYDTLRHWKGISPFGLDVIQEMNRAGILIDISHSTDSTVFQALRHSIAPVVATHSSCRYFTPGFERNLSDTLIKAIAEKNGVVMIAFGSMFLDSICSKNILYLMNWFDSTEVERRSAEGQEFIQRYMESHKLLADSNQVVDHIDHVVKLAGIDYVGLGSDYDGVGPSQPRGLPDVSSYPVIVYELLKRNYSEEEIKKILSGNFLRVWKEAIEISDSLKRGT